MNKSSILIFIIITLFTLNLSSCSQKVFLNGTLVHTTDKLPVSGAVLYAETWKNNKPVSFTFGITGADGKVPVKPPIPVPLRKRAMVSIAVFTDEYSPAVVSRAIIGGKYQRIEFIVEKKNEDDVTLPGMLAFPFEEDSHLLNTLKDPIYKPLFVHWLDAFGYIFEQKESLPLYMRNRLVKMKTAVEMLKKYYGIE